MSTKLGSSGQESSILAVSSASATVSSSTAPPVPPRRLRLRSNSLEASAASASFRDSLEEEDSSQSLGDSLKSDVFKSGTKEQQGTQSDFSDSLEDFGTETDDTAIDSDTGSFYSVDSHLTPQDHESEASLLDSKYFSESTLYNSAQSLLTPRPSSRSSFLSITSNETTDGILCRTVNQSNSLEYQTDSSDCKRDSSDVSLSYTSCPDLSPSGYPPRGRSPYFSSSLSPTQASSPVKYSYLSNQVETWSSSLRKNTVSSSNMSAVEGNGSPKVGDELETKKKKGLMSSFRKSRKTSRKLRQQKKAAADGDSTSTGTGVTSDGEQDLLFDSEPSAPNSPAPVKNAIREIATNAVENTVEKPEETVVDDQTTHERLNGTTSIKESVELNSKNNLIDETAKKPEEKEEKKIGRSKFGGSIFRKKKTEQVSTAPPTTDVSAEQVSTAPPTTDVSAEQVSTAPPTTDANAEVPELKEGEEGEGQKTTDTEPPTSDVAQLDQTEDPKPAEPKPSSFRSYISSVQFVKNWTASSDNPKAQQTSEALAKTSLGAVDGEKEADGTDTAPEGTASAIIETKKVTTSTNGKPSATEAGASTDKREHLYKILVIGELGTGKTSIIKRYVHQFFSQHYRATIGVDFALKVLNWDNNTVIRLQLWDIAGQERFGNMTRVYYKEAVGAFVVFDVTRAQTFDAVAKWKTDLDTKVTLADGSPIPTVLLANKCDQPKEGVVNNPARMDDYCRERGFSGWFETSAKENINIDEASRFLVNKILSNEKQGMMMTESMDTDKFSVDGKANPVDKSGCRC